VRACVHGHGDVRLVPTQEKSEAVSYLIALTTHVNALSIPPIRAAKGRFVFLFFLAWLGLGLLTWRERERERERERNSRENLLTSRMEAMGHLGSSSARLAKYLVCVGVCVCVSVCFEGVGGGGACSVC
jgi:hypothetical protein